MSFGSKRSKSRIISDFAINPRGELWRKDEQNFGSKLLKKMGWKNGEGLGKDGTGITEPLRVVQTYDNEGLGYSSQTSDYSWNWLSHHDDYDVLLKELQAQHSTSPNSRSNDVSKTSNPTPHVVDLEKKSKQSRKRVHYQRSIKGKNMSNRSQSEWQCILGVKRKRKVLLEESDLEDKSDEGQKGRLFTSSVSSFAYFVSKKPRIEVKDEHQNYCSENEGVVPEDSAFSQKYSCSETEQKNQKGPNSNKLKKKKRRGRKSQKEGEEESESAESFPGSEQVVPEDCVSSRENSCNETEQLDHKEPNDKLKRKNKKGNKKKQQKECAESLPDGPLPQTPDDRHEKENDFQAEDSLIVFRRTKMKMKKKKKRALLKDNVIADVTNVEQDSSKTPLIEGKCCLKSVNESSDDNKHAGILKFRPELFAFETCEHRLVHHERRVNFSDKPLVGYVPAKDSVRGGAWMWKKRFNILTI